MKQKITQGPIYAILVAIQHYRLGEEGSINVVNLFASNGGKKIGCEVATHCGWQCEGEALALQPRPLPMLGMSPGMWWFLSPAKCWGSLLQSLKQGQC